MDCDGMMRPAPRGLHSIWTPLASSMHTPSSSFSGRTSPRNHRRGVGIPVVSPGAINTIRARPVSLHALAALSGQQTKRTRQAALDPPLEGFLPNKPVSYESSCLMFTRRGIPLQGKDRRYADAP